MLRAALNPTGIAQVSQVQISASVRNVLIHLKGSVAASTKAVTLRG
jgi:hypothetical protein